MRKTAFLLCVSLFFVSMFSACGVHQKVHVDFTSTEPLRVMVLPFVRYEDGKIINADESLFVDGIPLLSESLLEHPAELLRQMVQTELSKTGLDIIAPYLVNIELPHHGFALADGTIALQKLYASPAKGLCQDFLDCDAVLYGYVTDWDRSYYGVQTVNSVGLQLRLVSARTEKVLFETEVSNDDGRGISGGPTGFSDIVLEPIKGLDSKYIEESARVVAQAAVEPLQTGIKAPATNEAPPSLYAVAHSPNRLPASAKRPLLVLAYAQAGGTASFSIGDTIVDFPMVEVEPSKYVGQYQVLENEQLIGQVVSVTLIDTYGRKTTQTSASGLLTIE